MAQNMRGLDISQSVPSLDRLGGPLNQTVDSLSYRTYSMNSQDDNEEHWEPYLQCVKESRDMVSQLVNDQFHQKLKKELQAGQIGQLQIIQCQQSYINLRKELTLKKKVRQKIHSELIATFSAKINSSMEPNFKSTQRRLLLKKHVNKAEGEEFSMCSEENQAFELIKSQISILQNYHQLRIFQQKSINLLKEEKIKNININQQDIPQQKNIMIKRSEKKSPIIFNPNNVIYEHEFEESIEQIKDEEAISKVPSKKQIEKEDEMKYAKSSPLSIMNKMLSPKDQAGNKLQALQRIKLVQPNYCFTLQKQHCDQNITFIVDLPFKIDLKLNEYNLIAEIKDRKFNFYISIFGSRPKAPQKQFNLPYTNQSLLVWHRPIPKKLPRTQITETTFKRYSLVDKFNFGNIKYEVRKETVQYECQGNEIISIENFSGESESCYGKRLTVERKKQNKKTQGKILSTTWYILKQIKEKSKGITEINVRVVSNGQ